MTAPQVAPKVAPTPPIKNIDIYMNMIILMNMNIYITKPNEKFLKTIHENKKSMSGLINKLLDDYRGPESKPKELTSKNENIKTIKPIPEIIEDHIAQLTAINEKALAPQSITLKPLVTATDRFSGPTCKIHGLPLDNRGKCLQKGCKYA